MTPASEDDLPPRPELLAAYADGELTGCARRRVAAWLAAHPEAAAEVERQRELSRQNRDLWDETAVPLPADETWDRALADIRAGIEQERLKPRRRLTVRRAAVLAACAAGVCALVGRLPWSQPPGLTPASEPAFVLMASGDVEVHSIRPDDESTLLVGTSPVPETLIWANAGDVTFDNDETGDPARPAAAGKPILISARTR